MSACRLCQGQTCRMWARKVLGKYDVDYFECQVCGSLQTTEPHWLDEAYAEKGTGFDTGAVQRSVDCALTLSTALEILGLSPATDCLDYGAGTGVFARMMRDRGWLFYAHEKYAVPYYMDKFVAEPASRDWGLVSAYEVFEHLPYPAQTLGEILGAARDLVVFSTELWQGQGPDWPYLNPMQGHHVFFYSARGLETIGARYGFAYYDLGFTKCFARPSLGQRIDMLRQPDFGRKVVEAFLRHLQNPYQYAMRDNAELVTAANNPGEA